MLKAQDGPTEPEARKRVRQRQRGPQEAPNQNGPWPMLPVSEAQAHRRKQS